MPRVTLASVEVKGVRDLIEKLQENPVHAKPWRTALRAAVNLGVRTAQGRAPRLSGKLAATVRGKVGRGKVPEYGFITAGRSRKGFRFGFALDAGHGKRKSGRQYEFRRSDNRQPTRAWFSGTLDVIQRGINSLLSQAAREIESDWGH